MLFFGDVVGGVVGGEGYLVLGDDLAGIADGGYPVDGHAGLCFACFLYGLMNVVAPHAFAAILGQQGGEAGVVTGGAVEVIGVLCLQNIALEYCDFCKISYSGVIILCKISRFRIIIGIFARKNVLL